MTIIEQLIYLDRMTIIEQSKDAVTAPSTTASLQFLTDKTAIAELVFTVARAMDARDWELLAACFAPDPEGDFATGTVRGLAAVLDEYKAFLTPLDVTQHLVGNVVSALDGDSATSHATFQAQHVRTDADGSGRYLLGGDYDDILVRTPSGWRIQKRRVSGLWSAGDPTVFARPLTRA
ncbi:nuclear transport factor 2 family protein [Leifsonia naganoensis]|uniref:3-phenylpropionate/cinnamic acid dioxygenase small subunit n=1 Tax=Leifsonia naganoensis TaxID=150025 RepID=A0A853DNC9_9MICO|nr:nuclear transport factor 2 family protein [Leifsonia naganoensis]NYK10586.1 3-phenylpropionate/cinnamic acid dioxygenase small subunit [Leifsonia naganoensis]